MNLRALAALMAVSFIAVLFAVAPLPAQVLEEFRELYGHTILERYGMSETLMNMSNPYAGERRAGTVGLPLPGVSVRLLNPELQPVSDGDDRPSSHQAVELLLDRRFDFGIERRGRLVEH